MRRASGALVAAAILVGGCGGDDNSARSGDRGGGEAGGKPAPKVLPASESAGVSGTQDEFNTYCGGRFTGEATAQDQARAERAADYLIALYQDYPKDNVLRAIISTNASNWSPDCPPAKRLEQATFSSLAP